MATEQRPGDAPDNDHNNTTNNNSTTTAADLHRWSAALASIARTGLGFTPNNYETERYHEILAVAADIGAAARSMDGEEPVAPAELEATWLRAVGSGVPGYVTPKVAVGAVVADDQGRMLLIQRSDSGHWLYPTGWADVGYSTSEVAVKEVHEETGIRCRVIRPLAIIDGLRAGFSRVPLHSIVYLCRAVGGELSPHPQECLDAGWFGPDDLPEPMANVELWGPHAFAAIAGERSGDGVMFDRPRDEVWRGDPLPSSPDGEAS